MTGALLTLGVQSYIIDGEGVWSGPDGKSDVDKLHSCIHVDQVCLYAFDLLELNGEDYRQHPLEKRKGYLPRQTKPISSSRFLRSADIASFLAR